LCVIATGRYASFVEPLLASADKFFLPGHDVDYHVFSDTDFRSRPGVVWHLIRNPKPWPWPTLHRYHIILDVREDEWEDYDYIYYIDADMRCVGGIGDEIFGKIVATEHPGFVGRQANCLTYERRPQSACSVPFGTGERYYAGGFQGGETKHFIAAMLTMQAMIDRDEGKGIVPVWHDESAWNKWIIDHRPDVVLPMAYCAPEHWNREGAKILALGKDVAEMRGAV
jgi:histo-blood group ABO system transferase